MNAATSASVWEIYQNIIVNTAFKSIKPFLRLACTNALTFFLKKSLCLVLLHS